ncbi:uncharacterized protein LACBIDRAFT_328620 [Laccaria bicolor S238N-H82]|uniref:Predicted protein n=1 Tax=Laccaria bicolor (strain S238N-H82 / ATCC MYA-4686) TaxID=486041 RepID=B0DFG1_LACBS|nr:uncharacterized protein LACBIDRAFT_328620 [Laccaria bicolor S238N-H82]EDR06856.1 predicted protein [Laccaria bicolor S238N-H82]|eukprot:XP_001882703.1 predicted protein [Laccaria bicolor S238N-H82]
MAYQKTRRTYDIPRGAAACRNFSLEQARVAPDRDLTTLAALKRWHEAEEYFKISFVSAYPQSTGLFMIKKGRPSPLYPSRRKRTGVEEADSGVFDRLQRLQVTPLAALKRWHEAEEYFEICVTSLEVDLLRSNQAVGDARALKRLTATYVTLHLATIGKAIKIGSEDEVRELLPSVETGTSKELSKVCRHDCRFLSCKDDSTWAPTAHKEMFWTIEG